MSPHSQNRPNPFPGLRPFRSDEHHLFFGREEQTAALLQLLRTNRFLAVVGASGSGKSSLVRAGMIAELHGGTMTQAGSTWEVMILRPGGSPIENLARAFVDAALYDGEDPSTLPRLLATLSRSRYGLVEAMRQSEIFEPGANLLVVVDQFEELFRFRQQGVDSEETAAAFVNLLLTASEQAECPIFVTITMRSDYLGDCSEIPGLAEAVNRGEYLIPRLQRDQKRDAIEKPIGVGGGTISALLVQRLLNDVGDDPDQLPVLQHALMRMWEAWSRGSDPNRPIDFADLEATGGLASALSNHADEIYDALPTDRHRSACAKIFKTLTEKGADNRGIRRPTRLAKLQAIAAADRATVATVLDAFRGAGVTFLMPGMEVELGDRTVIDLSHESLMRGWQRLRGWVEDEAQSARIFRRLFDTARLWSDGKAGLFRDPDLQIALSWREQEAPNADWAEQYGGHLPTAIGFLEASNAEAEAERQAKEAARQRELEQARQLAEARQLRLEQQQRAARKLRMMIGGLAVVALIAGLAFVVALVARNEASRLATIAEQEADKARQSQQETQHALDLAESQKAKAEFAEKRSRELRYATDMQLAARLIDDQQGNARQLLGLLAAHDPDDPNNPDQKGKDDLRGFEWYCLRRLVDSRAAIFRTGDQPVIDFTLTPDGELITLDKTARLRRFDATSRRETRPALELKKGRSLGAMCLSADGRRVALASDSKIYLFDTETGAEVVPAIAALAQFGMTFSPDNTMLVTVDAMIGWWTAATGAPISSSESKLSGAGPVSISSDGLTLAVGRQYTAGFFDRGYSVFRLNPDERKVTILQHRTTASLLYTRTFALSPDGSQLAVSDFYSGGVVLFDTATGENERRFPHPAPVSAIVFDPRGTEMVTASLDGSIKVWSDTKVGDLAKANPPESTALMGHTEEVTRIAFAPGAKRLISSGRDKTTRLWDLTEKSASIHRTVDGVFTSRAKFSPDGLLIAAAEHKVRLRETATGRLVRELPGPVGFEYDPDVPAANSVAFAPDNRCLAIGIGGRNDLSYVELWDIDRGERLAVLPGTTDIPDFRTTNITGFVGALSFSPNGRFLVAGFGDFSNVGRFPVKVYDVATRRARVLWGHENACVSVVFSADGTRMATGSHDGTARIWDTSTWKTLHVLQNPDPRTPLGEGRVFHVAFSPSADLLAMASGEGNVHVWKAATGEYVRKLKGPANGVCSVAFSVDGRTLAVGSFDKTVRLWNVATWREVLRLDPEVSDLYESLVFSPDGTQLLAAGWPAIFWSTRPDDEQRRTAQGLATLLDSQADFASRIRMISEGTALEEALEVLRRQRPDETRLQGALAAARANRHATRQQWKEAVQVFDQLRSLPPHEPAAWFRTNGLLRLAAALIHEDRTRDAVDLLSGGVRRRTEDGLPAAVEPVGVGSTKSDADGETLHHIRTAIQARLDRDPRNPVLLELRAELAGQWSDWKSQAADYSTAIAIVTEQAGTSAAADLQRLYAHRGNAHLASRQWQEAIDDYARVVSDTTTDEFLLSKQALALAERALAKMIDTLVPTSEREGMKWRFTTAKPNDEWTKPEFNDSSWNERMGPFATPDLSQSRTAWTTRDIWLRRSFDGSTAKNVEMLFFRINCDDFAYVFLNGKPVVPKANWTNRAFIIHQFDQQVRDLLVPGKNTLAVHCQNTGGPGYIDIGMYGATVGSLALNKRHLAATQIIDPWLKLATVHQLQGDQQALDHLVERRPKLAGPVGDLFAEGKDEAKDWRRALALYTKGITNETTDALLLSKRARANLALKNWDAAAADCARAAAGNPDAAKLVAEFARQLAAAGEIPLANGHLEKAQTLYERALAADPENDVAATELAQLLINRHENSNPAPWTVIQPREKVMKSEGGADLTVQPDGSVLASGVSPDRDIYTLEGEILGPVIAVKLEALTDLTLKNKGPGRSDNGNVHLNDIRVTLAPGGTLVWSRAYADFEQSGRWVRYAIDDDPNTNWGIAPKMGEAHWGLFVASDSGAVAGKIRIAVRLDTGNKERIRTTLGRFRISVCGDPATLDLEQKRHGVLTATDPWLKLGAAYALNGQKDEALQYFGRAFARADGFESRKPILDLAARFDVVVHLAERTAARVPVPTTVFPTSKDEEQKWRYTTDQPAEGWQWANFDDKHWREGFGGFGRQNASVGRTEWKTDDIWLRREFALPEGTWDDLALLLYHDDDAEVYINGVLAVNAPGWRVDYKEMPLSAAARSALKPGKNVCAVHCHNVAGTQYIDVGLVAMKAYDGRLAIAHYFFDRKQFVLATRLWAEALASNPKLSNDRLTPHRENSARAAALAAGGQSKDEALPDDAAKAKLRGQALDWLKAELKLLSSGLPANRPTIVRTLSRWQKDTDLAGIRDAAALTALPPDERQAITQFWTDVATALKKAQEKPK